MIIGLTGGIASGKSTVSALFKERSIPVVDADCIAREVVEPGKVAYQQIVEAFGENILLPNEEIDRKALGEIIFSDEQQRQILNRIVHPEVRKEMTRQAQEALQEGHDLVIMDIPLLFESKLQYMVDKIILVYVPSEVQRIRLIERDDLDEEQAQKRIHAQFPIETKKNEADYIIDNSGTREETIKQVDQLLVTLQTEMKQ